MTLPADDNFKGAQLSVSNLRDRACQSAGLTDFGDDWFLEPLAHLVEFVNSEAGLTSDESSPVHVLVDHLANRLKMTEYLKHNPGVFDEKVEVPGVIIGHGRGGSTLLQRLLAASLQLTAPRWWELITPIPLPDEERGDFGARIKMGHDWIEGFKAASPEVESIHPPEAMAHEEEWALINHSFLGMMFSSYFYIPSYDLWLMEQDHAKAYGELKLWLQLMQYQDKERRGQKWILKSPHHLMAGNLQTLLKTFPEAKLIMTHRNLENVIGSLCSAGAMFIRASGSMTADLKKLGPVRMAAYIRALEHMMQVRREQPPDRFIDVQYNDLMLDPIALFRRGMKLMGLPVGPDDIKAAADWMADYPRGSFPPHAYHLEDYGLTREMIAGSFKFYHDAFLGSG